MTEIERKALELSSEAWARTIEERNALQAEFDAFRQEVSDAVGFALKVYGGHSGPLDPLRRFITTKPDPLVEAITECGYATFAEQFTKDLRAALAKRGLEIREKSE